MREIPSQANLTSPNLQFRSGSLSHEAGEERGSTKYRNNGAVVGFEEEVMKGPPTRRP
jgi:hypothetical protein